MIALDLFCGGGGAARGILAAGFDDIVGIDIKNHRKSYPGHFVQGDALNPPVRLEDFDFVWASPPCQRFSQGLDNNPERRALHPDLIDPVRRMLAGTVHVIENVPPAPIRADVVLSGAMFDLPLVRRRHFEVSGFRPPFALMREHGGKTVTNGDLACVAGSGINNAHGHKGIKWRHLPLELKSRLKRRNSIPGWRDAMGLQPGEMTRNEIKESIPPAYAEFIAREALRQMTCAKS